MSPSSLAELFPAGGYRFHLTLRRDEPAAFFRHRDGTGRLLADRVRWLSTEPARYAALLPEGVPLAEEAAALPAAWNGGSADEGPKPTAGSLIHALGTSLEPDVLLLSPDPEGKFRLRGGAVCFASGWALEEKLGHTVDFIHDVVPGLNAALAAPIHHFLSRLRPGVAFLRDNWGIAATGEFNLHPSRGFPPPGQPVRLDLLWLRIEHQALVAMPGSRGILFGIRIAVHRLDAVARDPAAAGLRRALDTMPAAVAAYKRLDAIRGDLLALLPT